MKQSDNAFSRVAKLEQEISELRADVGYLRQVIAQIKKELLRREDD